MWYRRYTENGVDLLVNLGSGPVQTVEVYATGGAQSWAVVVYFGVEDWRRIYIAKDQDNGRAECERWLQVLASEMDLVDGRGRFVG